MIDGERTYLTGDWTPDENGTPAEKLVDAGIPDLLFEHFGDRLEWHAPWHTGRELSLLMRGQGRRRRGERADPRRAATRTCASSTTARSAGRWRAVDGTAHAYHLVPGGASKAKGVAFHLRARGYAPEDCIAVGDSIEDLEAAAAVGRFFCVANGPERDEALREALGGLRERHRHRGRDGRRLLRGRGLDPGDALRAPIPGGRLEYRCLRTTPQSPRRSTSRSCSGSRRRGCRSPAPTSPARCSSRPRPCTR